MWGLSYNNSSRRHFEIFFFVYFSEKMRLGRRFTWNVKPHFLSIFFLKLERRLPQYYLALECAKPLFFLGTAQGACCGKNTANSMAPDNVETKAIIYGILFSYSKPEHNVLSIGIPLLKLSILFLCKCTKKKIKKIYLLYTKCQNLFFFVFFFWENKNVVCWKFYSACTICLISTLNLRTIHTANVD